jgi:hypothetical protein
MPRKFLENELPRFGLPILVCGGVALLVLAARGDLWFDEVWSLFFAVSSESWSDLLNLRYDNNHMINTLYLRFCGSQGHIIVYRLLSVFCGATSLALIAALTKKYWGAGAALLAVLIAGTSYPLILYFSEARGYAGAIFCSLSAYWLLNATLTRGGFLFPAGFALTCIVGLLFHSTFVTVLVGLMIGAGVHLLEHRKSLARDAIRLASAMSVPAAFTVFWYFFFMNQLETAGGPKTGAWAAATHAAALALGAPPTGIGAAIAFGFAIAVVGLGARAERRAGTPLWASLPAIALVAPTLLVIVSKPTYLYARHFLVCVPFLYLATLRPILSGLASEKPWIKLSVAVAIIGLLGGQSARTWNLLSKQRGSYRQALADVWNASGQSEISIASDHDVRNSLMIAFYSPPAAGPKQIKYLANGQPGADRADWYFFNSQDPSERPSPTVRFTRGASYGLFREYPYEGISGWSWFVYRRDD